MRSLLPSFLLVLLLALPGAVHAQWSDSEEAIAAEGEAPGEDTASDDGAGYEPDQRGAQDETPEDGSTEGGEEQASGGGDSYEPDQRGVEDEARRYEPAAQELTGELAGVTQVEADYASEGSRSGGIGFDFYLWLGAGTTALDAIEGNDLLLPTQTSSIGGSFGLTLGLRVGPVTVGPRLSWVIEPSFVLSTVGLDAIVALMRGPIVPTVRAGVSLAIVDPTADTLPSQNLAFGLQLELGVGVRASLGSGFFLGGELSAGYLAMSRAAVSACVDPCTDGGAFDLRRTGSAHGLSGRLHLLLGWGF